MQAAYSLGLGFSSIWKPARYRSGANPGPLTFNSGFHYNQFWGQSIASLVSRSRGTIGPPAPPSAWPPLLGVRRRSGTGLRAPGLGAAGLRCTVGRAPPGHRGWLYRLASGRRRFARCQFAGPPPRWIQAGRFAPGFAPLLRRYFALPAQFRFISPAGIFAGIRWGSAYSSSPRAAIFSGPSLLRADFAGTPPPRLSSPTRHSQAVFVAAGHRRIRQLPARQRFAARVTPGLAGHISPWGGPAACLKRHVGAGPGATAGRWANISGQRPGQATGTPVDMLTGLQDIRNNIITAATFMAHRAGQAHSAGTGHWITPALPGSFAIYIAVCSAPGRPHYTIGRFVCASSVYTALRSSVRVNTIIRRAGPGHSVPAQYSLPGRLSIRLGSCIAIFTFHRPGSAFAIQRYNTPPATASSSPGSGHADRFALPRFRQRAATFAQSSHSAAFRPITPLQSHRSIPPPPFATGIPDSSTGSAPFARALASGYFAPGRGLSGDLLSINLFNITMIEQNYSSTGALAKYSRSVNQASTLPA